MQSFKFLMHKTPFKYFSANLSLTEHLKEIQRLNLKDKSCCDFNSCFLRAM